MYKRILVPVDGSDTSTRGLKEAVKLAKALNARLKLVHVLDQSPLVLAPEIGLVNLMNSLVAAGTEILERARAYAERHGVKVETAMPETTGRVADVILDEARKWRADLIVMGTHGRRGVTHLLLGSDAERVLRASPVPVLLVRGEPETAARRTRREKASGRRAAAR